MIEVGLPDGSVRQMPPGATAMDLAQAIGPKLARDAVAAVVNGATVDLKAPLPDRAEVRILTLKDPEGLEVLRHTTSHVMAQAVRRLFGDVALAIGPAIENGFYYDFGLARAFAPEELAKIEEEMRRIVAEDLPLERFCLPKAEALKLFAEKEPYKAELIEGLADDEVSLYRQGEFVDLCRGPHLISTGRVAAFKLLSVAGAYWRGDEKRPMLQRIYGTAWGTKEELEAYLKKLEEIERRDHRRLGKDLDLFSVHEETGAGLILWHPKGGRLRNAIESFWREEHFRNGYEIVYSPHIGKGLLWETSGHLGFYRENMYSSMDIDGIEYYAKPMNCPFHIMIYKNRAWSYRDLPLRWAELGTVYRYERSGALHGLLRVRGFTQDDAHLFCRPDQMPAEIDRVLAFSLHLLRSFGFQDFRIYLATRPKEGAVGEPERWTAATQALEESVKRAGLEYEVDEGGGAFYGPKIDIKIKDALGREWQCTTIQFDFNMSERFDLTYRDSDGKDRRPYMIHRALLGSLERFIGVLIEHYAGAFPVWLAPVQAVVIPVAQAHADYAEQVRAELVAAGLRVEVDARDEKLGYRIREAQTDRIPYMLVVGDKEVAENAVAVRTRAGGDRGAVAVGRFKEELLAEVRERRN
ncbi:MAG: threonine--tRNA ligase [Bacteroidota bacterium]